MTNQPVSLGLCLLFAFVSFTKSAHGAEMINVVKIRHLEFNQGGSLEVGYALPCQARPLGLLAKPKKDKLYLGMVIAHDGVQCMHMPQMMYETIDYLDFTGIKQIIRMAPRNLSRKLVLRSSPLVRLARQQGRAQLEAIYESTCQKFAGYMLSKSPDRTLGVSFIEERLSKRAGRCQFDQTLHRLGFVNGASLKHAYAFRRDHDLQRAFHVRITRTLPRSIQRLPKGGIRVSYLRRCNEAPIGLVVRQRNDETKIGVVVAHYINRSCGGSSHLIRDDYANPRLKLPARSRLAVLPESKGLNRFRLRAPAHFGIQPAQQHVEVDYLSTCRAPIGVVYGVDGSDQHTLGILEGSERNKQCNHQVKKLSLKQGLGLRGKKVFPMRLFGSVI